MSINVMNLVWLWYPGASTPELLVLLALADWCDDDGRNCYPAIDKIGKKCRLSRSQTQRIVHRLIESGLVSVIDNANGGAPGTTRRYQINLDRLTGSENATGRENATGSKTTSEGSQKCAERGRENATQSITDPSVNTKPSARERKTSIPADWTLPDDYKAWALEERKDWTPEHCLLVAASFADHWRGKGEARADWLATWRNWVRREGKFQRTPKTSRIPAPDNFAGRQYGQGGLI